MGTPYVGEIRMGAWSFAPAGWAFCDGQLMPISEYETLFNLIGTTYGGDGQSTFALPNLAGRVPIHMGTGQGLSSYVIGESGGVSVVTLTTQQIPQHVHAIQCSSGDGTSRSPVNNFPARELTGATNVYAAAAPNANMSVTAIGIGGGSQPHDNMQPSLSISFIISLFGVFPSPT